LKRRDTEQLSTLTRLQRLSSDPSQSKFIVLNPISLSSSLPPTPASILHSKISSSEVTLLEESLRESHEGRMECEGENRGLREVLGEVGEWCEGILDLRGIGREGLDEDEGDQVSTALIRSRKSTDGGCGSRGRFPTRPIRHRSLSSRTVCTRTCSTSARPSSTSSVLPTFRSSRRGRKSRLRWRGRGSGGSRRRGLGR
jgi:hypothetical protein